MAKTTQVDRDLIAAARYFERQYNEAPAYHLLDVVSDSLALGDVPHVKRKVAELRRRYHHCATRLFSCIGTDLADFDKDEAVDMLVAAAYWRP